MFSEKGVIDSLIEAVEARLLTALELEMLLSEVKRLAVVIRIELAREEAGHGW